ncbi:MAG: hypothetical protein LRY39_00940 [Alphaproteobacteria bacterium]|nr:hypothetical protein [Alphaproteobacteria bacterium]
MIKAFVTTPYLEIRMSKYGNGSTTIDKFRKEAKRYIDSLQERSAKLDAEIKKIKQDSSDILKEFKATAKTFAHNTLYELEGPAFDNIADLAQNIPQLTGQGLAYYRQSLFDRREAGLAAVNRILKETVDVATFPAVLATAQTGYNLARNNAEQAQAAAAEAGKKLQEWNDSDEHKFVEFDQSLRSTGKPGIGPDTRDYYDTESLREAIIRYITRDASYRNVRRTLVSYRQGFDGRDAFADIGTFKEKEAALSSAVKAATQKKEGGWIRCMMPRKSSWMLFPSVKRIFLMMLPY